MTSEKKRKLFGWLAVLGLFVISRALYEGAGFTFDTIYIYGWHVIDMPLLQNDLWRSIFYLHSQPPLWNLFLGLAVQIFPSHYEIFFHIFYHLLGFILAAAIYQLGLSLRLPVWLAALVSILFSGSPSAALFEHWLGYTYPLLVMVTLAGVSLYQFAVTRKTGWGILFFSLLAAVAMTWSLFHLLWMFGVALILYLVWNDKRQILISASIPFLLVFGWYAKNLIFFGDFGASSWAGMNLSRVITFRVPEPERKQLVKAGELSEFALIPPFRNPKVYLKILSDTPQTGIPLLDRTETTHGSHRNQHHLVYVEAAHYYLKDALKLMARHPEVYARGVLQAAYIYFHSSSDFEYLELNRARIDWLDDGWNRFFYGQWASGESAGERLNSMSPAHIGWGILFAFVIGAAGSLRFLYIHRAELASPTMTVLLYMLFTLLFVTTVGISMEIGENNRFRLIVDPFSALLFVFVIRYLYAEFFARKPQNQNG